MSLWEKSLPNEGRLSESNYVSLPILLNIYGSAFGTQVWFPEDKVTLTSGELSIYENNTESGNVVTLNFCKNCGSTIFLRLNVFQGMVAIPGGSFYPPTFWFEPQVENFCRTKAPFIQTSTAEKHDTHPMYNPKTPDNHPVK